MRRTTFEAAGSQELRRWYAVGALGRSVPLGSSTGEYGRAQVALPRRGMHPVEGVSIPYWG